jgi:hypothetical protein
MAYKHKQEKPGRFGTETAFVQGSTINVTASSTTNVAISSPRRKSYIERLTMTAGSAIVTGSGAITCIVSKKSAAGDVALCSAFTCTGLTAHRSVSIPILSTVTDAQRVLQEGETLNVIYTAAGTVTQQPVGGYIVAAELSVLE